MKTGKRDTKVSIMITGRELKELQKYIWLMAESYGLDRRIENYRGKRSVGLYRWDMECLLDVLSIVLEDPQEGPPKGSMEHNVTQDLYQRLERIYNSTYER